MSVQDKAMIVNLGISMWTARKYDAKVSKKIEDAYTAENSGRYNKILIAKERISAIQKITNSARIYHYENTLPWFDSGGRLLPTENYLTYAKEMQGYRMQFEQAVSDFIALYETYKDEAVGRLGGMYDPNDYPDAVNLPSKYSFKIQILPVPDINDFRIQLNEDEMDSIKSDMQEALEQSTKAAMRDLWQRMHKAVSHMVERLSTIDAKFHNSLVGNIQEMCDLLPRLNITNDPDLDMMLTEVRDQLAVLSPDELRNDSNKRYRAAAAAQQILDKMSQYAPMA